MIHIYCDGGLGNRLMMMFSGLYFAKETNKEFIIHWPSNNWCGCNFTDLFDNKYNISNFNLKFIDANVLHTCTLLVHEMQIQFKPNKAINNSLISKANMLQLFETEKDVLYYGNSLHSSLTLNDVSPIIKSLSVTKSVMNMIEPYNMDNSYGVHIRGTDFPEAPFITIPQLEEEISRNIDSKYFICSDQKNIEDLFLTKYKNTYSFKKEQYVEPLDKSKGWGGRITDDLDRSFNFNVNRSKTSVIEAFCDMLLLSKTRLLKTSNSSFLKCAHALGKGKII